MATYHKDNVQFEDQCLDCLEHEYERDSSDGGITCATRMSDGLCCEGHSAPDDGDGSRGAAARRSAIADSVPLVSTSSRTGDKSAQGETTRVITTGTSRLGTTPSSAAAAAAPAALRRPALDRAPVALGGGLELGKESAVNIAIVGAREFGKDRAGAPNQNAWDFLGRLFAGLEKKWGSFHFVSGGAPGADSMSEYVAKKRGHDMSVFCLHAGPATVKDDEGVFKPVLVKTTIASGDVLTKWAMRECTKSGHVPQDYAWERILPDGTLIKQKDAGFKRNEVIVAHADVVVALIHEASRGTRHTVHLAMEQGKDVHLFHAYTFERLSSCPCDDDEAHERIAKSRAESTYHTVTIAERDMLAAGDESCSCPLLPHWHSPKQHAETVMDDWALALWQEKECQTCGAEIDADAGGCTKCSDPKYGAEAVVEEDEPECSDPVKHLTCKCATERNYFVRPRYIPQMRDPFIGASKKRLVNGYWLYIRKDGKPVYATAAAEQGAAAHLASLPQGPYTL